MKSSRAPAMWGPITPVGLRSWDLLNFPRFLLKIEASTEEDPHVESHWHRAAKALGLCSVAPSAIALAVAVGCALLLGPGVGVAQESGGAPNEAAAATIPPDQLDSLVAPIALYPDSLLAQVLVASTYPLELIQLQQWLEKNTTLKDDALAEAVAKQPWDPSIQSMAAFPDVVKWLTGDIQWTTDLGNTFLAQQSDVMDAVQRMRKKAQDKGALASNEQQTVETQVIEDKTVIVVESADPEVIYVPSYSPTVVYGPPVYPYPPIYYPPYTPGAAFVTFGFGMMMGAAIWGGSCCGCGWGGNDVDINVNNNFNKQTIRGEGGRGQGGRGDGSWKHNPQHRGGTPYSNKATANKFGGSARGDSLSSRQAGARQQVARQQPTARSRPSAPGGGGRPSAAAGSRPAAGAGGSRAATHGAGGGAAGGSERMGSRQIPKSSASRQGGFGGGSHGYSGKSARASSSRGARSVGGMGGGGGGGRGGGGRRR